MPLLTSIHCLLALWKTYVDNDAGPGTSVVKPNRFGRSISDKELDDAIKGRVPKNTKKGTSWGVGVWSAWCAERDITKDILHMTVEELNYHISRFVQEAVKRDGQPYPPNSIYQITVSLQHYLRETGRPEVSFFDENNPLFSDLLMHA